VDVDGDLAAAALSTVPGPSVVDEDPAHRLGGNGEEVAPVAGREMFAGIEAHVRLVDESGRAEGVAGTFSPQLRSGEHAQVVVDEGEQPFERVRIAVAQPVEPRRDWRIGRTGLGHRPASYPTRRGPAIDRAALPPRGQAPDSGSSGGEGSRRRSSSASRARPSASRYATYSRTAPRKSGCVWPSGARIAMARRYAVSAAVRSPRSRAMRARPRTGWATIACSGPSASSMRSRARVKRRFAVSTSPS